MNINDMPRPQEMAPGIASEKTIDLKQVEAELIKNRVRRALYFVAGVLALGLGIVGLFVPGLPTTPFVLLAAALLARSNRRLYNWLLNNRVLGPRIRNYQRRRGITMRGKYRIIALMGTMVLFSAFVIIQAWPVRVVVLLAGVVGSVVVRFFVPTAANDGSSG